MKATEILSNEHRIIEQVLDCLERMADQCAADGGLDGQSAKGAIEFFRVFADQCHHGKEEAHLFPALEAKGFPRSGGPTGVMMEEHELGRRHVSQMAGLVDAASAGDRGAQQRFVEHARGYVSLLRGHIQKEDHCLFGMANQALDDMEQQQLLDAFGRVESDQMGAGAHERYLRLAHDLADRYGVDPVPAAGHSGGGCGH